MNIGDAVALLKEGRMVARSGWNGRNMWLIYIDTRRWVVLDVLSFGGYLPFVALKTPDNKLVPWLCSQTDLLAEDWVEVTAGEALDSDVNPPRVSDKPETPDVNPDPPIDNLEGAA